MTSPPQLTRISEGLLYLLSGLLETTTLNNASCIAGQGALGMGLWSHGAVPRKSLRTNILELILFSGDCCFVPLLQAMHIVSTLHAAGLMAKCL
jgi:hypothetical protein